MISAKRLKIFTWHIHGTYLYYLSRGDFDIYIPLNDKRSTGYVGRGQTFPFGENIIEVRAEEVRNLEFDCILFQTSRNYLTDQYEILSEEQRRLPRVFVEHDPPTDHPTDTLHVVADPNVILVHVTHFNKLMWHSPIPETRVIEHGVPLSDVQYTGELKKGIVVINHLRDRGRKLGSDIFEEVARHVPLDLIGMDSLKSGGLGEILHPDLPHFISHYRFFFNPIRYTSMGLAVCEALSIGLPVVALATTENASVFTNGVDAYMHTDVDYLIEKMLLLLQNPELAGRIGSKGKELAKNKFSLERFTKEWKETFLMAIINNTPQYEHKNSLY